MKYLAVLGRQPEISVAELEALGVGLSIESNAEGLSADSHSGVLFGRPVATGGRRFVSRLVRTPLHCKSADSIKLALDIDRLGGTLKLAEQIDGRPIEYLQKLPDGKITIGVSDYSEHASKETAAREALKLKKILVRHGRSVRVVENKAAVLSTATSLHNGLSGSNLRKVELIKVNSEWYRVIGVQDIDAYARRDQARPARDAKVGMLPPKLAQILINLCGPLPEGARILDPFCGTGVVLQEALLMGYRAYGTDVSERMIEYSRKNLEWLVSGKHIASTRAMLQDGMGTQGGGKFCMCMDGRGGDEPCMCVDGQRSDNWKGKEFFVLEQGDATTFEWAQPIDAVVCEGYLGQPMSQIPSEMKLKEQKQECEAIILGFLKNLAVQIRPGTPVVIAAPAWRRPDGEYERLDFLKQLEQLGNDVGNEGERDARRLEKKIDKMSNLGYNVSNKTREGLLYLREGQVVARDIIILRKN